MDTHTHTHSYGIEFILEMTTENLLAEFTTTIMDFHSNINAAF